MKLSFEINGIDASPQSGMHIEIVGFNCQCLFDRKLIAWIIHSEVEFLQDKSNRKKCFLPRKWSPNTATHTITKRLEDISILYYISNHWHRLTNLPGVFGELIEGFFQHAFGSECTGVFSKDSRVTVDDGEQCYDWYSWWDLVFRCANRDWAFNTRL